MKKFRLWSLNPYSVNLKQDISNQDEWPQYRILMEWRSEVVNSSNYLFHCSVCLLPLTI